MKSTTFSSLKYCGTDRYAVMCISVESPKRIVLTRLYGLDENNIKNNPDIIFDNSYMYIKDDKWKNYYPSKFEKWSLRKNGKWKEMNSLYSSTIMWGNAEPYRDPDF